MMISNGSTSRRSIEDKLSIVDVQYNKFIDEMKYIKAPLLGYISIHKKCNTHVECDDDGICRCKKCKSIISDLSSIKYIPVTGSMDDKSKKRIFKLFSETPGIYSKLDTMTKYYIGSDGLKLAIKYNPALLCDTSITQTKELCDIAMETDPTSIHFINKDYMCDDYIRLLLHKDPSKIKDYQHDNKDFCELAMSIDPNIYPLIDRDNRNIEMYATYRNHKKADSYKLDEMLSKVSTLDNRFDGLLSTQFKFRLLMTFKYTEGGSVAYNSIYLFIKSIFPSTVYTTGASYASTDKTCPYIRILKNDIISIRTELLSGDDIDTINKYMNCIGVLHSYGFIHTDDSNHTDVLVDTAENTIDDIYNITNLYINSINSIESIIKNSCVYKDVPRKLIEDIRNLHEFKLLPSTKLHELGRPFAIDPFRHIYDSCIVFRQHAPTTSYTDVMIWLHLLNKIVDNREVERPKSYFISSFFDKLSITGDVRSILSSRYCNVPVKNVYRQDVLEISSGTEYKSFVENQYGNIY